MPDNFVRSFFRYPARSSASLSDAETASEHAIPPPALLLVRADSSSFSRLSTQSLSPSPSYHITCQGPRPCPSSSEPSPFPQSDFAGLPPRPCSTRTSTVPNSSCANMSPTPPAEELQDWNESRSSDSDSGQKGGYAIKEKKLTWVSPSLPFARWCCRW